MISDTDMIGFFNLPIKVTAMNDKTQKHSDYHS
ncbi:hypothetical protein ISN44_As05g012760 [Arabidopsis suecica]|uniref:Uncharacterized protein n=1 Tax=Arabidopsis suecica TaxID=45249 RepID=A0A8T2DIL1_ARASU|nr:hypothetical protein ISN44_As05g012760 [Arabidopsis suecica]